MTFVLGDHIRQFVKSMMQRFGKAARQLRRANSGDAPPFISDGQEEIIERWGFLRVNPPPTGTHYGCPVLVPWSPPSGNS